MENKVIITGVKKIEARHFLSDKIRLCGKGEDYSVLVGDDTIIKISTGFFGTKKDYKVAIKKAELWFNFHGASQETKWVIEVFGKKYLDEMAEIGKRLSDKFEISIEVKLVSETDGHIHDVYGVIPFDAP